MASLDATIVNIALPQIARDLDVGISGLQWVTSGYLVTLAALVLLGGALGDALGRRRVFVGGIVGFAAASVACGVAPSAELLVAGRLLQGVGGAFVTPGSLALIQASFRADERSGAVGSWSAWGGVAGAVGPFLGGWVVSGPGWRWAFLLNIPLAAGAIVASRSIPESRADASDGRFDIVGSAVAVTALGVGTWGLISAGDRGWGDPLVVTAFVIAVTAGVAFVFVQRRSRHPLVPGSLFASRTFTVLNLATIVLYGALGLLFFLVVFALQVVAGWSPLTAGSALLPATLLMLAGSAASGRLAERIGPRPQMIVGPLLVAVGFVLLSGISADTDWFTDVLPGALAVGIGLTTFVAPLTAAVMASVDDDHVGAASAVNNAVARTGSLAAIAAVPVAAGLTAARDVDATRDAYQMAMWIAGGLAASSAVVSAIGLRRDCGVRHSERTTTVRSTELRCNPSRTTRSQRSEPPGAREAIDVGRRANFAGVGDPEVDVELVHVAVERGVATITLDSPANRNALSLGLVSGLHRALDVAEAASPRAIVLTHTSNTFCAGADLKERGTGKVDSTPMVNAMRRLSDSEAPTIAAVKGAVRAGGVGLMAACDLVVVAPTTTFAFTEVRIGVAPAIICVPILARVQPSHLRAPFLTGEAFDAAAAKNMGLVTHVAESVEGVDEVVAALVEGIRLGAPAAVAQSKRILRRVAGMERDAAYEEMRALSESMFLDPDGVEGMAAFREKRQPAWVTNG